MAKKIRVHELAKQLGLSNTELLEIMRGEGIEVASHLAGVDADTAELVTDHVTATRAGQPGQAAAEAEPEGADVSEPEADAATEVEGEVEGEVPPAPAGPQEVHLKPPVVVRDLAEALKIKPNELIHELLSMNVLASINQKLDMAVAEKLCARHGCVLVADRRSKAVEGVGGGGGEVAPEEVVYADAEVTPRPPVIAFLGHVDHGKTSLLDRILHTNVTAEESGGITQHIGASTIDWQGHPLSFIDTPGHEAFTAMRARGANVTDIVVLVVAADDGFMPQTIEALNHARAAGVQIVVAMNKMDLPGADAERILRQMQENNLSPEAWGGEWAAIPVSAETGEGIDDLLERLVLETEMLELKANPALPVKAVVLEAEVTTGLGVTANVLVKNGTIHRGDMVLCGQYCGKVKALVNSAGKRVKSAGPSTPVKVVGLSGVPECGALLVGCTDEREARRLTGEREEQQRQEQLKSTRKASLEDLFRQIEEEARKTLCLVVKTDVQGTAEAIVDALNRLSTEKVSVNVLHTGVGAVSENDVLLGSASDAIVIGFHVRVNPGVNALAKQEGVQIRLYSVIYELIDEVRNAMVGMVEPELRESPLGQAKILQVFTLSKTGKICGCGVTKGVVRAGAHARVLRGKELIYNGSILSLRRFQDDVKEVRQGLECGIRLDNFTEFEVDDIVEVYEYVETPASL